MKAYTGGDETLEIQQKSRGFKTYRDMYNKKTNEAENTGRTLREQQKEIKVRELDDFLLVLSLLFNVSFSLLF